MRICRYQEAPDGPIKLGVVEGDQVFDVSAATDRLPPQRWPYPPGDLLIAHLEELKPVMADLAAKGSPRAVADVLLKSPVANPGKFICGAGNHRVVVEAGHNPRAMGMLFKMTSANAGPSDGVELRWPERTVFHELEIATVIGKSGTRIRAEDALDHVAGYAIGLDMTLQGREFNTFSKSFDSFGVIGPWMVTPDEIPDTSILGYELTVNGELRTKDSVGNLAIDIPHLIEFASSVMTLHPGDVIFSGTPPPGLGPVVPGDVMRARMDVIGEMNVAVRAGEPGHQPYEV
ncbi:MAG TPA: fumarylacetoacetate hydrolase family protein [Sphingobium sp.]|uniref:fumarylacetoacetate hydrolase family protein n=1 Tax=Sphingobium sp. TaxID=1912891 RepID=UPI002ED2E8F2